MFRGVIASRERAITVKPQTRGFQLVIMIAKDLQPMFLWATRPPAAKLQDWFSLVGYESSLKNSSPASRPLRQWLDAPSLGEQNEAAGDVNEPVRQHYSPSELPTHELVSNILLPGNSLQGGPPTLELQIGKNSKYMSDYNTLRTTFR
ncbi:hypothetical protein ACU8KH_00223 [Lachancea thermotolerans]